MTSEFSRCQLSFLCPGWITAGLPVKRGVAANRSLPVDLFVLMQPRNGLACPQAGRISVSKFLGDSAQYGVIVRGLVARHSPPVHRLRCKMRIPIASDHIAYHRSASEYFL